MTMPEYQVAAYATSINHYAWDPVWEAEYLEALAALDRYTVLEVPWAGRLGLRDEEGFLRYLASAPDRWSLSLTSIVDVGMQRGADPSYGLASDDETARGRAVDRLLELRQSLLAVNSLLGRRAVRSVHVFSSPSADRGSADSLRRSLDALLALEWDGAELLLEHADALVPTHEPEKGFQPLAVELDVIAGYAPERIRAAINWGRSVIELRDADRLVEHIAAVRSVGRLGDLTFSGVAAVESPWGRPWIDLHPPFADPIDAAHAVPESLLTRARAAAALEAAGDVEVLGVKIMARPDVQDVASRVALLETTAETIAASLRR
jgi:hypothetical protein